MDEKILLTIWLDGLYGCVNKCSYCYVSHTMINKQNIFNYNNLVFFLSKNYKKIFRIEIMGHEIYNQVDIKKILLILNKFNFDLNTIFLTTNGIHFYNNVINETGITLSFNGFSSLKTNLSKIKGKIILNNLKKYFLECHNIIDKINWIVGDFNIEFLDKDILELHLYLKSLGIDSKNIVIKFLLQKGIKFDDNSVVIYKIKIDIVNNMIRKYFLVFGQFIQKKYNNIGNEPTEITYCINRENNKNWYRCPWEIIDEKYTLDETLYIDGKTNECSNICSAIGGDINKLNKKQIAYYKLLLNEIDKLNDI